METRNTVQLLRLRIMDRRLETGDKRQETTGTESACAGMLSMLFKSK